MNMNPEVAAHDPKNGFSSGGGFRCVIFRSGGLGLMSPEVSLPRSASKLLPLRHAHNSQLLIRKANADFEIMGNSSYFGRPAYQDSAVTAYIDSLDGQFRGLFNTSGRGYPDISAQGFHFLTIWNGTIVPLDGTRFVDT